MCPGAVLREGVSSCEHVDHCVSVNTPDGGWYEEISPL